jgi:hypothetical protein
VQVLVTWLLLTVAGLIFGGIAATLGLALSFPAARALLFGEWGPAAVVSLVVAATYYAVVGIGIGGVLTGFNSTVWTVLYKTLAEPIAPELLPAEAV